MNSAWLTNRPTRQTTQKSRATEFDQLAGIARELGFDNVASGPMVRSSYHADLQASGEKIS